MTPAKRPSLFLRLSAIFALAIALPLAGSAWFVIRNASQWAEAEAERREVAVAAFAESLVLSTVQRAEVKLATLARLLENSAEPEGGKDTRLLEAQVEPPDVFLELQSFASNETIEPRSQVQQRGLDVDASSNAFRMHSNLMTSAVNAPVQLRVAWRSPKFELLGEVPTLALSAPSVSGGVTRGVLLGYVDFRELRAALARAAGEQFLVEVIDGEGTPLAQAGSAEKPARTLVGSVRGTEWSVVVSESQARIDAPVARLRRQLLAWGGLGLVLAILAGFLLAAWIARPIARLESAAKRMTEGDFAARSGVQGADEIGRLGLAFDRMAEGFERLDTAKSAFVANVSHELRTPLTSLRLSVENLLEGVRGPLSEPQRTTLARVERDLTRLARLVDDLLELARLEAGVGELALEAHDLRVLALDAIEPWRELAAARDVRIEVQGEGRGLADAALLRRALSNLIDNAIRFSPDGGKLELELEDGVFRLRDEGPGLAGTHLFERFVQGEQHGAKSSGVGIGLSLARQAVRLMGGTIEALGREDGRSGAVFVVRLRKA